VTANISTNDSFQGMSPTWSIGISAKSAMINGNMNLANREELMEFTFK